jgi:Galactose binding lectin domain
MPWALSTNVFVDTLHESSSEYCQHETMTIKCRWKSEVIVMTSARWGRMQTGRCLNIHPNFLTLNGQDPLFLGCSEDVIPIVDQQCSGHSECDFRIQEQLSSVTPCYPDLARYLEASHTCVRGILGISCISLRLLASTRNKIDNMCIKVCCFIQVSILSS